MGEIRSNILLVDDSRSARSRISEILENAGCSVILAVDGQDGLEKLREQDVDLIISDLEMPLLDGLGLCRAVKTDRQLSQIYFIMLTARTELATRVQGLDTGADDYIVKTTHPAELMARVRAGLRIRRLEKELQRAQAYLFHAEKIASIGQLAAGLAHEINNPLGFIISNLGSLDKYLARLSGFIADQDAVLTSIGEPPKEIGRLTEHRRQLNIDRLLEDGKELISESRDGAERIAGLIGKLRDFTSDEADDFRLTDLNQSLELAICFLMQEFKTLSPPRKDFGEIPLTRCYPNQLNQVFASLLHNAAQAIDQDGEISVVSRCEGKEIILTVADSGRGIPENNLDRIFDPFFTTRAVGAGTGLGLTISYDIVCKHGGSLIAESRLGEGTTFTVRLPVQP